MLGCIWILAVGITLGLMGFIGSENASGRGNTGRALVFVVVMVIGIVVVMAGVMRVLGMLRY